MRPSQRINSNICNYLLIAIQKSQSITIIPFPIIIRSPLRATKKTSLSMMKMTISSSLTKTDQQVSIINIDMGNSSTKKTLKMPLMTKTKMKMT